MTVLHWLYNEFTKITGAFVSFVVAVRHGPEVWQTVKEWFGLAQDIERRIGDRRIVHMDFKDLITDAEAFAGAEPEFKAVISAVAALIAKIKAIEAAKIAPKAA
jgi:hypothetical protein